MPRLRVGRRRAERSGRQMNEQDVTLLCMSHAPLEKLVAYKRLAHGRCRGCPLRDDFLFDYGFAFRREEMSGVVREGFDMGQLLREAPQWLRDYREEVGAPDLESAVSVSAGWSVFAMRDGASTTPTACIRTRASSRRCSRCCSSCCRTRPSPRRLGRAAPADGPAPRQQQDAHLLPLAEQAPDQSARWLVPWTSSRALTLGGATPGAEDAPYPSPSESCPTASRAKGSAQSRLTPARPPRQGRQAPRGRDGRLGLGTNTPVVGPASRDARGYPLLRGGGPHSRACLDTRGSPDADAQIGGASRSPSTIRAASAAPCARGRNGQRRRAAERHPAPARTCRPWSHLDLPPGDRQPRDHQHRARPRRTDDVSQRWPRTPITTSTRKSRKRQRRSTIRLEGASASDVLVERGCLLGASSGRAIRFSKRDRFGIGAVE